MVMSFRVSDLQMLLGFVGRSKSGLKHELVTRALQLVQFDCSPELFKKIKELYETRYAKKSSEPVPQAHRPLDPLTMHSTYDRAGTVPRTPLSGPNIDYPVLYGKYLNGLGRLPAKTLKPEVRLVKLPFFNMLDELLKPTELGESATALWGGGVPPSAFSQRLWPATSPTQSVFREAARAEGSWGAFPPRKHRSHLWIFILVTCRVVSRISLNLSNLA